MMPKFLPAVNGTASKWHRTGVGANLRSFTPTPAPFARGNGIACLHGQSPSPGTQT
jgi:hypothetical protein